MSNPTYRARVAGEAAAKALLEGLNWGGQDFIDAFAEKLTDGHRTLQQDAFRAFVACLEKWAGDRAEGYYDDRNRSTVTFSAEILKLLPDIKLLPRI